MTDRGETEIEYGTRWGRVLAVLLPVLLVVGSLGVSLGKGVIAASVVAQSSDATLVTTGLQGDGVGLIIATQATRQPNGEVTSRSVRRLGVGKAAANGLCLAQPVRIVGQSFTVLIIASDYDPDTYEILLDKAILDVDKVAAFVQTKGNTAANKNAADIQVGTSGLSLNGTPDSFGLQSTKVDIRNATAKVQALTVPDTLFTPAFTVKMLPGTQPCPDPNKR